MSYIVIIIGAFVIIVLFNMIKDSFKGKYYWEKCEKEYLSLLKQGYDNKTALFKISKQSHPNLSDFVHEQIVEKFDNLDKLVLFIFNALDFKAENKPWGKTAHYYNKEINDQIALSILDNTTINKKGMVNTDLSAVEKEIQ